MTDCLRTFVLATLVMASPAFAAVITFNGTAEDAGFTEFATGTSYTEAGYRLDSVAELPIFIDNDFDSGGVGNVDDLSGFDDDVLEFDDVGAAVTVQRSDGGLFDAIDVDVGQLDALGSLQFTGFLGGIMQSTISLSSCGDACIQTLAIGFAGIDQLRIEATSLFPVIDNLQVVAAAAPVPEPHTLALMALGFATLAALRRRKQLVRA